MTKTKEVPDSQFGQVIFQSETMNQLMRMVKRVAPRYASVLILGESGTGKELISKTIHDQSRRSSRPLVMINCGALRETLLESEIFGHEKGAFTGAYSRKVGLIEVARGGTLLLKSVNELGPGLQAKLLRFLQEDEFYRVGGKEALKSDVRLITTSSMNLDQQVMRGNFREDLYYRINTITMQVPALKQRKEDVIALAEYFLSQGPGNHLSISEDARKLLVKYDWPGNVCELETVCERLCVLVENSIIQEGDLPEHIKNPKQQEVPTYKYDPSMCLHGLEKRYILEALNHFKGNKSEAADALGITIKTLYNKLHEYGEI